MNCKTINNGCCFNLLKLLILTATWLAVGCASTPEEETTSTTLNRTDLYAGQSTITLGQNQAPKNELEALEQAKQAENLRKFDKAIYAYIQALEFAPDNAKTLYHIARIHTQRGNHIIALKAYKEALALNPKMTDVHAELGVLAMDQRQHELARTHLFKAIELDQLRLNNTLVKIAKQELVPLDKQSPLRAYNAIAILEDLNNNHVKANRYFRLALAQQPRSALLATNLGYSLYLSGHYVLAERYLKQAIEYAPKFKRAWTNLGLVYARKGLYNRALITFEQIMPPAEALNDLGYLLMLEHKYDKAIELFRRAIDTSPSYFEQANKNLKRATLGYKEQAARISTTSSGFSSTLKLKP